MSLFLARGVPADWESKLFRGDRVTKILGTPCQSPEASQLSVDALAQAEGVAENHYPRFDFKVHIVDEAMVNTFAMPGGISS